MLTPWFSRLRSTCAPRPPTSTRRKLASRRRRPCLDALEDRQMLSTVFTVTNTNDSGTGSLRQAIINSNATKVTTGSPL